MFAVLSSSAQVNLDARTRAQLDKAQEEIIKSLRIHRITSGDSISASDGTSTVKQVLCTAAAYLMPCARVEHATGVIVADRCG